MQALIHSDAARRGAFEEYRSVKLSTYGIVFMGTPHQGGSGVALGRLMVSVASILVAAAEAGAIRADQRGVCDEACVRDVRDADGARTVDGGGQSTNVFSVQGNVY